MLTKADKGYSVVAINREDNISKTIEFISSYNFDILKHNPTKEIQRDAEEVIKNIDCFISNSNK